MGGFGDFGKITIKMDKWTRYRFLREESPRVGANPPKLAVDDGGRRAAHSFNSADYGNYRSKIDAACDELCSIYKLLVSLYHKSNQLSSAGVRDRAFPKSDRRALIAMLGIASAGWLPPEAILLGKTETLSIYPFKW